MIKRFVCFPVPGLLIQQVEHIGFFFDARRGREGRWTAAVASIIDMEKQCLGATLGQPVGR
jgi:hypothetical protein